MSQIDLSNLPPPDVVELLDFEIILAEMKADLIQRLPEIEPLLALEDSLIAQILQVAAYREIILRVRVNEAAKAVMLAHALGADLDNLGALLGVERAVVDTDHLGDPSPPVEAMEDDERFRKRIQLSLEGFSTAGPIGAYAFHALSADSNVKDVSITSPEPGDVLVTILSGTGDGEASADLISMVNATLNDETVRPLCDNVTVQSATIIAYAIEARLYFFNGPDRALVMTEAVKAAQDYTSEQHRLGRDITLSGLYAALHRPGVQRVELTEPAADITIESNQAAFCASIELADGGAVNE